MRVVSVVSRVDEKGPIIVAEKIGLGVPENIEYIFLSLRKNNDIDLKRMNQLGFKVIEMSMHKIPKINDFINFKKVIRSLKPDIIHTHSFWPTIFGAMLNNIKKVTTVHNYPTEDFAYEYGKFFGVICSFVFDLACLKYDRVVCISDYVKSYFNKRPINKQKISVVYNGIEDKLTDEKKISNVVGQTLKACSLSVIIKRKNIDLIVDGIHKAIIDNKCDKKIGYTIIGDGPQKNDIEKKVKDLKLCDNVNLLGLVSREDALKKLRSQNVLIHAAKSEGLCLSVIEAMMLGVVPIVYDIPVFREYIIDGYNGYFYSNYNELAEILNKIIKNEDMTSISRNARKTFIEKFTINMMCSGYENVYVNLN